METIEIPLPDGYSNFSFVLKKAGNENNLLCYIPRYKDEIIFIDLSANEIDTIYKFLNEGPESISGLNGISILKNDYYLSASGEIGFYVYDHEFKFKQKIDLNYLMPNLNTSSVTLRSAINKDIYEINPGFLLFPQIPIHKANESRNFEKEHLKAPLLLVYSIEEKSLSSIECFLPKDYFDNGSKLIEYSLTRNSEEAVISLMYSNKVMVVSKDLKVNYVEIEQSKNIEKISTVGYTSNPIEYYLNLSSYMNIYYDFTRNLYYRIAVFPHQNIEMKDITDVDDIYFKKNFSIMVLDDKFNVVNEFIMNDDLDYVPSMIFISEGNIYISKSNPYSKNYLENALVFDVFSFK